MSKMKKNDELDTPQSHLLNSKLPKKDSMDSTSTQMYDELSGSRMAVNKSLSMTISSASSPKLLEADTYQEQLYRKSELTKGRFFDNIKQIANELDEIDGQHDQETVISREFSEFVSIFSFKSNISFLFQPNSLIKYKNGLERSAPEEVRDLEIVNGIYCILIVWGLAISTPYYLLAAPLFNVWRFLVLFGHYLVVAVFSGHCVPELIILVSTFLGFVFFDRKYLEAHYTMKKFLKLSGFVLLKKYIKFFILTIVATAFALYISPFLIQSPNYYVSGISYET